jgi:hypothetical protein
MSFSQFEEPPSLINALTESIDFVDIHNGLSRASDLHMLPKLRQFVRGAKMLRDKTKAANQPRTIGFEMLIAPAAADSPLERAGSTRIPDVQIPPRGGSRRTDIAEHCD